jgi:hypothetical protein
MCILCDCVSNNKPFVITDYIKSTVNDPNMLYYSDNYITIKPMGYPIKHHYVLVSRLSIDIYNCNNIKILPDIIFPNEPIIIDNSKHNHRNYTINSFIINIKNLSNLEKIDNIINDKYSIGISICGCNELKYIKNILGCELAIVNCNNLELVENICKIEIFKIKGCNNINILNNINNINNIDIIDSVIKNISNMSNIGRLYFNDKNNLYCSYNNIINILYISYDCRIIKLFLNNTTYNNNDIYHLFNNNEYVDYTGYREHHILNYGIDLSKILNIVSNFLITISNNKYMEHIINTDVNDIQLNLYENIMEDIKLLK